MAAVLSNPTHLAGVDTMDTVKTHTWAPYDPEAYDTLPSLRVARGRFQDQNAMATIVGAIRNVFLKHKIHKQVGIALLHSHFSMESTERLVDCRNISAPWEIGTDRSPVVSKYDGFVVPRSFRLMNGTLVPYEFDYSDTPSHSTLDQEFLSELSALILEHGLEDVLGLRILDHRNPELSVEVTEGKINLMIRRGIIPDEELTQALWVFGEDDDDGCHCVEICRNNDIKGHYEKVHKTT